jgi:hypothetical protein
MDYAVRTQATLISRMPLGASPDTAHQTIETASSAQKANEDGDLSAAHTPLDPETHNGPGVLLGKRLICTLTGSNAGLSPNERMELIIKRLDAALKQGAVKTDVGVRVLEDGQRWGVFIRDSLLMVASGEDAKSRGEHAAVTAERCARNLRAALPSETLAKLNLASSAQETSTNERFVYMPSHVGSKDADERSQRIDELETRIREMSAEVEQAQSEADDLETYVHRFAVDSWRDVVPLVRSAAGEIVTALDAIDTSDP